MLFAEKYQNAQRVYLTGIAAVFLNSATMTRKANREQYCSDVSTQRIHSVRLVQPVLDSQLQLPNSQICTDLKPRYSLPIILFYYLYPESSELIGIELNRC